MNHSKMKLLFATLTLAMIAGCASPYTDFEYGETISRVSVAGICEREKLLNNDDYNVYTAYQLSLGQQNRRIVDNGRMQKLYMDDLERIRTVKFTPAELDKVRPYCVNVGVVAHRIRQQGTQQQSPVWVPSTVTSNCMTTYGWTRCTTN